MEPAIGLAAFLREYGPWALLSLSLLANKFLFGLWRECMEKRIEERGILALSLEKQATSNTAVAASLEDVREGQTEIVKLTTESLKRAEGSDELAKSHLGDIRRSLDTLSHKGGA